MLEFGYVRLYRSLINWEWYTDINTKVVFIHLILTANYETQQWRGISVERGQRIYSRASLAAELRMSERSIRTALNHLISTGEVTNQTMPQYSIITIKNYDEYQQPTNETTNDRPTTDQPTTSDRPLCNKANKSNKAINKKNIYSVAFESYSQGDESLLKALNDFAEMRKAKKKPISTQRTVEMLLHKLDSLASDSQTKIKVLEQSIFHNWDSAFPLKEDSTKSNNKFSDPQHTPSYDIDAYERQSIFDDEVPND